MRERDAQARMNRAQPVGHAQLVLGVRGPEHRRDGGLADSRGRQRRAGPLDLPAVERPDRTAVVLPAAAHEEHRVGDGRAQISRPVDHRRQRLRYRRADTNRRHGLEVAALDQCVGERRRADVNAIIGSVPRTSASAASRPTSTSAVVGTFAQAATRPALSRRHPCWFRQRRRRSRSCDTSNSNGKDE